MTLDSRLPVVFIGPMGSGKSRIGRKVAAAIGVPFIDTDSVVVAGHGAISDIFERDGEQRFRELERQAVSESLAEQAVVSLGGGAVLDPRTQDDLRGATVVLLTVTSAAVAKRIQGGKRPLVADGGITAWERILEERRPIYEDLAAATFDTSTGSLTELADDIVTWLKEG
ncbi:shikimate kinase [Leifsonia flava]|uniref:Shikimate kinase n=1 Tax=Orlajensenia leifsoniae TaxID=2561933 RepID=A0A4Y9R2S7_9MICO|nr:shikimate kinase [Leifsonia flava]TFV98954.1 shikimate kinase [Leifsonia flava]